MHVDSSQNGFEKTLSLVIFESSIFQYFIYAHILEVCDELFKIEIT